MSQRHVIVIDDDKEMRSLLRDFLTGEGYRVSEHSSAKAALTQLIGEEKTADEVDLVITDLKMPEMTGLEFIARFKVIHSRVPVILITAFGSIESAVEATRKGAYDYIVKPFKLTEIGVTVSRALNYRHLERENAILRDEIRSSHSFANIIGKSPGMHEVFDLIRRVSQATANVLINGESGTGKERVARAIHDLGPRAQRPFVAINCTAIPETLLESELFGHAKGSFTGAMNRKAGLFEEAKGGTVFLDEIGDMDMSLQSKLLRVIQERKIRAVGDNVDREIDIRLIAATHKDLKAAIKNGTFREDLYYRLSVIPIVIPPLRHRKEDIPLLAENFLRKYAAANASQVRGFSADAMARLMSLNWEGNVRELENVVERAVVLSKGIAIEVGDLPKIEEATADNFFAGAKSQFPTLEDLERQYIKFILDKTGSRKEKAAQILGINRRTLYRKEREYGFVSEGDAQVDDDILEELDTERPQ